MLIELLNQSADSWSRFMLTGVRDAGLLLLLLSLIWLLLHRRLSAQFTYCLFLLVLLRVAVPVQLTLPGWCDFVPLVTQLDAVAGPVETRLAVTAPMSIRQADELENPAGFDSSLEFTPTSSLPASPPRTALQPSSPQLGSLAAAPFEPAQLSSQPSEPLVDPALRPALTPEAGLMIGWGGVVLALSIGTLLVQRRLHGVLRRSSRLDPDSLELAELRRRAGVRQIVRVSSSQEIISPAVCGLWRPHILLPANFAEIFSPPQLRWILLHELAHLRRFDLWLAAFQRLVQIVHFFNPAIWLANWIINRQREFACDDVALSVADVPRRDCAAAFLAVVERASQRPMIGPLRLGFLRSPNPLRRRLMRILDTSRPLRPRLTRGSLLALAVIGCLVVPQLRRGVWAQSEGRAEREEAPADAANELAPAGQPAAVRNEPAQPPSRAQTTNPPALPKPPQSQSLQDRIQTLESEVRKLRELLEELTAQRRAGGTVPPGQAALVDAEVKRMDLVTGNRGRHVVLVNPLRNRTKDSQTKIKALIADGARVSKGEVLAELVSEDASSQLDTASVQREKARAELERATLAYENQRVKNDAALAEDRLQVELASLELQAYLEGTLPLELKKLEAKVVEAETELEQVLRLGKSAINEQTRKRAEIAVSIARSDLEKLNKFERILQLRRLEGAIQRAEAAYKQTKQQTATWLARAAAAVASAEQSLAYVETKLNKMQAESKQAKLLAPIDGTVRHSKSVSQGAMVRERQPIVWITPAGSTSQQLLKNVLVIPNSAIRRGLRSVSCYVRTPNGTEERTIEIGGTDGQFTQVLAGLVEGERVLQTPGASQ